jgi:hypothetical protein
MVPKTRSLYSLAPLTGTVLGKLSGKSHPIYLHG